MRARREAREAASTAAASVSDYTSQRLAELRLRRAESAADSYSDYKSRTTRDYASKSSAGKERDLSSSSFSDYDYKSRRKEELGNATTGGYSSATTTLTSSSSFKLDPRLEPNYQYNTGSRTSLNSKVRSQSFFFKLKMLLKQPVEGDWRQKHFKTFKYTFIHFTQMLLPLKTIQLEILHI